MSAVCTIRKATEADQPAIHRLLEDSDLAEAKELLRGGKTTRSHLLVLDAPDGDGLAATALLSMEGRKGRLVLLAIAPRFRGLGMEDRIVGVSEALCRAFGARDLEVHLPAHHY
jgi:N-acetylglutamate synthase-like GNAT family acetyltransferase